MEQIVFLDLETTGLDPTRDYILEIGVMVVSSRSLAVEASCAWVLKYENALRDRRDVRIGKRLLVQELLVEVEAHQIVRDMHSANNLLVECDGEAAVSVEAAEQGVLDLLGRWGASFHIVLGGYSPQFDRRFIEENMPALFARLSHRMVDVSTFRECAKVWTPELVEKSPAREQATHRALTDCQEAWEELRKYQAWWMR
jgi:oligoribonuclease